MTTRPIDSSEGPSVRTGVTLVELLVVLALIGLTAGIVGLAVLKKTDEGTRDETTGRIADVRRAALRSGRRMTASVQVGGRTYDVTALPDGSVLADSGLDVDRLTGRWGSDAQP